MEQMETPLPQPSMLPTELSPLRKDYVLECETGHYEVQWVPMPLPEVAKRV